MPNQCLVKKVAQAGKGEFGQYTSCEEPIQYSRYRTLHLQGLQIMTETVYGQRQVANLFKEHSVEQI